MDFKEGGVSLGTARIHAHRGESKHHPENTLAAFRAAATLGVDAIEFDVHASDDGSLFVHHDYDLARTTSGSGFIHDRSASYIRSLSAGGWFSPEFVDEPVPLLEEVLALRGVGFELELKGLPTDTLIEGIVAEIQNADAVAMVEVTGFQIGALAKLHQLAPDITLGLFAPAFEPWMTDGLYERLAIETALCGQFSVVHLPLERVDRFSRERLHERGISLHGSGSSNTTEATFALFNCDQMDTDSVENTVKLRAQLAANLKEENLQ